ncbi:MAG: hypothetical protein HUJ26_00105 [Planctomycetaceae bacterium]|nr:hypothetical protein [Planctomycetaceae bacterium]
MANEIHNKIIVAEAEMVFGTAFANIDSLPAGDLTWSDPLSAAAWDDAAWAEIFFQIKLGATSPAGSVEFYWGRAGTNLRAAENASLTGSNTLTSSGVEATAADVELMIASLGGPVHLFGANENASEIITGAFKVFNPGNGSQLYVYNNTDEALDGTSSPHKIYIRGFAPEVQ